LGIILKFANVQYVEMNKEKLYSFKDNKVVLKDDLNKYCQLIKQLLIRNVDKENKNEQGDSKKIKFKWI